MRLLPLLLNHSRLIIRREEREVKSMMRTLSMMSLRSKRELIPRPLAQIINYLKADSTLIIRIRHPPKTKSL
jgi:hypothetical protein